MSFFNDLQDTGCLQQAGEKRAAEDLGGASPATGGFAKPEMFRKKI
jgi:hypothetical protein